MKSWKEKSRNNKVKSIILRKKQRKRKLFEKRSKKHWKIYSNQRQLRRKQESLNWSLVHWGIQRIKDNSFSWSSIDIQSPKFQKRFDIKEKMSWNLLEDIDSNQSLKIGNKKKAPQNGGVFFCIEMVKFQILQARNRLQFRK